MKALRWVWAAAALGSPLGGCSSVDVPVAKDPDPPPASLPFDVSTGCGDAAESLYTAPPEGYASRPRGAILRCTRDPDLSAEELHARAVSTGYTGAMGSGARVYRILYRTERGTVPATPGYSVATVYIPTTPRAALLPAVVAARGSRGQAPHCAPSLDDPRAEVVRADHEAMLLPLIMGGYAVIAPDFAGYSNYGAAGNPPSAYGSAADVTPSVLDGARALRFFAASTVTAKTVLVGFSQGAHATLASLALAERYGYDGELVGVVAYAPLWFNQAVFGAALLVADQFPIATSPSIPNGTSVWYHYTAGYLRGGRDEALAPFVPEKRDAIAAWVDSACWGKQPQLEALGTTLRDLYTTEFQEAVTAMAAAGASCPAEEPTRGICETWRARYREERPRLQGLAARVPILLPYGGKDTALTPGRMACAIERLQRDDGANVELCIDPDAEHGTPVGIARRQADHVNAWIAHVALGAPAPGPCPADRLLDETGAPRGCDGIPPNGADL